MLRSRMRTSVFDLQDCVLTRTVSSSAKNCTIWSIIRGFHLNLDFTVTAGFRINPQPVESLSKGKVSLHSG